MLLPRSYDVCFSGERAMQLRRPLWAAVLLYGLGLGALGVSGGCGEAPTGTRGELSGELKEQSAAHGKRMKEYYAAKKAEKKGAVKGRAQ
jgi:hypothetical protein